MLHNLYLCSQLSAAISFEGYTCSRLVKDTMTIMLALWLVAFVKQEGDHKEKIT